MPYPPAQKPFRLTFRGAALRLALGLGLLVVLLFGLHGRAQAVVNDHDGVIAAGEVIDDDVYISAETASIAGTIQGNLFLSAGRAVITGPIHGDVIIWSNMTQLSGPVSGNVFFAGKILQIDGPVQGSVYFAGASLSLGPQAEIARNLHHMGFSLQTAPGSFIGRDAAIISRQAVLAGDIQQDLTSEVDALELNGSVGGSVIANLSAEPWPPVSWGGLPAALDPGLRVGTSARIGGQLEYTASQDQSAAILIAPAGGTVYNPVENPGLFPQGDFPALVRYWFSSRLRDLVTLLAVGGILLWKTPALLDLTAAQTQKPLPAAARGLLAIGLGYVGLATLAVAVVLVWFLLYGLTLGSFSTSILSLGLTSLSLAVAVFNFLITYGSKLFVAAAVGQWLASRAAPMQRWQPFWRLAAGVGLYVLVRSIPVLGDLTAILVTLVGMGAAWLAWHEWRKARAGSLPQPEAPAAASAAAD